ncbi:hypothetical protein CXU12_04945 [Akkermansia muciniphila]|nr:hypothetical protein CXU12_04945 [Akkermansia muciniphila]
MRHGGQPGRRARNITAAGFFQGQALTFRHRSHRSRNPHHFREKAGRIFVPPLISGGPFTIPFPHPDIDGQFRKESGPPDGACSGSPCFYPVNKDIP